MNTPSASHEPLERVPSSYIMKNLPPEILGPAAQMAELEGRIHRLVILDFLRRYGKEGM